MNNRKFGRTTWQVSEIGYGMWGMAGWTGSDDKATEAALSKAVELGCNFFDTAWAYGDGKSEQILGGLLKRHPGKTLYAATKVPPKNRKWPSVKGSSIDEVFPADYIEEYTEKSLKNLGLDCIDLLQFHVWEDAWNQREEWKECIGQLKREGKIKAFGLSVNRWESENCLETIESGLVDSIQVIYNIFDQAPEDKLFPKCAKLDIAIIARVPFDEGSLTGTLSKDSTWPEGDWRNLYFCPENLPESIDRAEALKLLVPEGSNLPEMALRFILNNDTVSTIIPGMRKLRHVIANMGAGDAAKLPLKLVQKLKEHRWDRQPTHWSY